MPHIHEKIDFTASAFVVYKNTVLLRRHDKYAIGWLGVGGHIELNEDPTEAVIREVREEVGLNVKLVGTPQVFNDASDEKDLIPPRFLNRHRINATHEHVDLVYFAIADTNIIKQGEKEQSEEIRWFSKEELSDPIVKINDRVRYYALKALEETSIQ
jgi:8-oxo-dGTP pyrophosphatase MutT (NUDIX family)